MLVTRIITALVALALFVPALLWAPAAVWTPLCALLTLWAAWEWGRLGGLGPAGVLGYCAVVALLDFLLFALPSTHAAAYWLAALFWVLAAPLLLAYAPKGPPGPPAWLKLAMGMVVLPPVFIAMAQLHAVSVGLLFFTMAVVWVSDSMAYFTGRALGRHKLAPGISPGKTWEGAAGALVCVAVYALILHAAWPGLPLPLALVLPLFLVLAAAGIVGDLLESLLKRWAGAKDSGKSLPGHGGILDRVDALLPVLPLAALAYLYRQ